MSYIVRIFNHGKMADIDFETKVEDNNLNVDK